MTTETAGKTSRQKLLISEIKENPSNPRAGKMDASLVEELTASIKEKGLLNPIVVRKKGKGWEVVAGSRRLAALKALQWEKVDALVYEDLSDDQALELAIIENIQRQDLPPVDEAKAFKNLLDNSKLTEEQIAERTGKKLQHVRNRLALLKFKPSILKALETGVLPLQGVAYVARLNSPQDFKAAEEQLEELISSAGYDDGAVSAERVRQVIEEEVLRELKSMPWDIKDANLVPEAGPCTTCPKNTTNQRSLFSDISAKDAKCTDGACYAKKVKAFSAEAIAKAKSKNQKVLTGEEAGNALRGGHYQKMDDTKDVTEDSSRYTPVAIRKIVASAVQKGMKADVVVAVDPETGRAYELVSRAQVGAAVSSYGKKKLVEAKGGVSPQRRAQLNRERLDRESKVQALGLIFDKVKKLAETPAGIKKLLEIFVRYRITRASYLDNHIAEKRRTERDGKEFPDIQGWGKVANFADQVALAFELEAAGDVQYGQPANVFKALGVTPAQGVAVARKVLADRAAAKKKAKQAVKK